MKPLGSYHAERAWWEPSSEGLSDFTQAFLLWDSTRLARVQLVQLLHVPLSFLVEVWGSWISIVLA